MPSASPVRSTPPPAGPGAARHATAGRVLVAVGAAVLAVAVTYWVSPYVPRTIFVLAFAAVSVSARYGGVRAGMLTSVLCVVGIDYYLLPPVRRLGLEDPNDYVPLAVFLAVSWLMGTLTESLRASQAVALESAARLREANTRLAGQAEALERANRELLEQSRELEMSNQQLQDQAVELEMTGEELQATAAELEERTEAAEEANRVKSEFLAVMSHELRTPLNAIAGYVELIGMGLHGPITREQTEALERIAVNQRHLLELINDILSHARIEAGRLEYSLQPLEVAEVVESVHQLIGRRAEARGIRYCGRPVEPGLALLGDPERVRQILLNLIGNSIKFTEPGGRIEVACESRPGEVVIAVTDTGRGIPSEKLEEIFDPFVQVGRALNRPEEGVGLGLTISRDLARGMGGDLTVRSKVGEGSTFALRLPRAG